MKASLSVPALTHLSRTALTPLVTVLQEKGVVHLKPFFCKSLTDAHIRELLAIVVINP